MIRLIFIASVVLCSTSTNGQDKEKLGQFQIPLTKCCTDQEFYVVGFDSCKVEEFIAPTAWPPPVYSVRTNESVADNPVTPLRFSLTYDLATCRPGFDSQTAANFRLYSDGSVMTTGRRLEPGQFCLNQILGNDDSEFAVRYCVPDPCNNTHCVRKCCPMGMALNETTRLCQTHDDPFVVVFQDTQGNVVTPDVGSYIIRDGDAPTCPEGMYSLSPEENPEDKFYILADGQMYAPGNLEDQQKATDYYCIDDFILSDGIVARKALTCFPEQNESPGNELVLKVFPYFLFVSSLFLIATFVVYAMIPEIRNIHGVTIMCHVASLAIMYIGLGIIQLDNELPNGVCVGIAVVVHFAFLSTFTWLNVMSFDIWWTFSDLRPRNSRHGRQHMGRRIIFYSIYAWGVPFVIVLVGQILDHIDDLPAHIVTPGFGEMKCWFAKYEAYMAYLYGPIAVLILSNIVFFVMTAVLLYRASIDAAFAVNSAHAKQKFRVIFSLFILMGVSWMMEVISFAVGGSAYIWIPTDIINILTGVFIFVIFVCKPNVWKLLKLKCPCLEGLDRCCPSYMKRANTRQGTTTTTRSTRNEVSVTKSLNNQTPAAANNQLDDPANKKSKYRSGSSRISTATATQSTQLRDSTQVDHSSGDDEATPVKMG